MSAQWIVLFEKGEHAELKIPKPNNELKVNNQNELKASYTTRGEIINYRLE